VRERRRNDEKQQISRAQTATNAHKIRNNNNNNTTTTQYHITSSHNITKYVTITYLLFDVLRRLELFYGKKQTSRRKEMRDIE
jgi:hypothetical protein